MSSGYTVADDCLTEYEFIKSGKKGDVYKKPEDRPRYFLMKIEGTEVVVQNFKERTTDCKADLEALIDVLPPNEGRFVCFDMEYKTSEGDRKKMIVINWNPDSGNIKTKMLYSSTTDTVKKKFSGAAAFVQATEKEEITWDDIVSKCEKKK